MICNNRGIGCNVFSIRILIVFHSFAILHSKQYKLLNAKNVYNLMMKWKDMYPNLIKVETSQETFGLERAGTELDCTFEEKKKGCSNYYFTIQDWIRNPLESEQDKSLPTVLLSGAVHGNERVGPTAVMEASGLLLECAHCEAQQPKNKECKQKLWLEKGINTSQRQWLSRLVSSRKIIVIPAANALGFDRRVREEGQYDVNRDFPYDLRDSRICMRTIAGRTLNELYRANVIQLSLTFHGGTEMLGYEWGNPSHYNELSPDHEAQNFIAQSLSSFGGGFLGHPVYQYGPMNDMIYFVRGGMEDWAYAGSWDTPHMINCQPTTFGGYPKEKTTYENGVLRCFNMLVETSWNKWPYPSSLGDDVDVLDEDNNLNGHVPRNIRLSIELVDLVEPYLEFLEINNQLLESSDVIPLHNCTNQKIQQHLLWDRVLEEDGFVVRWTVGGALAVDDTQLWIAADTDDVSTVFPNCQTTTTTSSQFEAVFQPIQGSSMTGSGYFSSSGPQPTLKGINTGLNKTLHSVIGPVFSAKLVWEDVARFLTSEQNSFVLVASARVDSSWADFPSNRGISPETKTIQAHVSQVRTNRSWFFQNEFGKRVQGREEWYSTPIQLVLHK